MLFLPALSNVAGTGSHYEFMNTNFNRNHISLTIESGVDLHSTCFGNQFTSVESVYDVLTHHIITTSPDDIIHIPPFAGNRSWKGILVNDVSHSINYTDGLHIGEVLYDGALDPPSHLDTDPPYLVTCNTWPNLNPCGANSFHNLDFGVYSSNSDLKIVNNEFIEIDDDYLIPGPDGEIDYGNTGTAIYSTGAWGVDTKLQGGDFYALNNANAAKNTFSDCLNGVVSLTNTTNDIKYNDFDHVRFASVNIADVQDLSLSVTNNNLAECTGGIMLSKISKSGMVTMPAATVEDNTFTYSTGTGGGSFITVWNAQLSDFPLQISNNTSTNSSRAILLSGIAGKSSQVTIADNHIFYANASQSLGISLLACKEILIEHNSINYPAPGVTPVSSFPRGITIQTSSTNTLLDNNIFESGTGILVFNSKFNNTFQCNWMKNDYNGMFIHNSNTGQQGDILH